ncbi:MAG: DUF6602 domain-containing protein [Gemmataceae bacterium]
MNEPNSPKTERDWSLTDLLRHTGDRLAHDLAQGLIPHRGEQGRVREEYIRGFLRRNLPRRFEVTTGFVFDSSGRISGQLDVIVADSQVAPRFELAGDVCFYPCECVVAVGQVRSRCDSEAKFLDAIENLRSASSLDRSANGKAVSIVDKRPLEPRFNHLDRMLTFVFVIDHALKGGTARDVLLQYLHDNGDEQAWPNLVFALDQYLLTYCCDDGVCPNTRHARGVALSRHSDETNTLLQFYAFLSQACAVISVAQPSYWEHLNGTLKFDAEVFYSSLHDDGERPPLISQWLR